MFRNVRFTVVGRVRLLAATTLLCLLAGATTRLAHDLDERGRALAKVDALAPALDMVQLARKSAEHRGLSAGFLAGGSAFVERREAKAREVAQAFETALGRLTGGTADDLSRRAAALQADWQSLLRAVGERSIDGPDSFARHTALISRVLALQQDLVWSSGLALDRDARVYHLVQGALLELPHVSELLGQLRGRGAGVIARGEAGAGERHWMTSRVEIAQSRFDGAAASLARTAEGGPGAVGPLALDEVRAGLADALALVRRQFEGESSFTVDGTAYFDRMSRAIDAQYALAGHAAEALADTLAARVRQATLAMIVSSALSLTVLLGVLWLAHRTVGSIRRQSGRAVAAAAALAERDFTHAATVMGQDEFADITRSIDVARQAIARAFGELRAGVETITCATREIATGNVDLSARTESQAASVQETAASIEQLSGGVSQNAAHALEAATLIRDTHVAADSGRTRMDEVVRTMHGIGEASRRIADIIGVIDGIAFQTNILALNAAVEAARAGEQGRGFAVVAAEVRTLAQRSAAAAREVRATIGAAGDQVEAGHAQVDEAGRAMHGIAEQVARVAQLVEQIGLASSEQSHGLGAVNTAVAQIDQATQQNAALVEQTAAASESLRVQAEQLVATMAAFRVAPG